MKSMGPGMSPFIINMANRIMSLGLDNQILVHDDFAKEVLRTKTIEGLVSIGNYTIKHDEVAGVYNYFKEGEFGNKETPTENKIN